MISLMDSMCFAAYACRLEELAEGTTMILFQERCLSFIRVAKRTNMQSIQGMDLPHTMEPNFMVQSFCSMDVMCISAMSFFSWV
jgi:hypothetical protein